MSRRSATGLTGGVPRGARARTQTARRRYAQHAMPVAASAEFTRERCDSRCATRACRSMRCAARSPRSACTTSWCLSTSPRLIRPPTSSSSTDGVRNSLALTLDEAGGRIWRCVRARWHDEAIRVRRVHGDAAARGARGCGAARRLCCDSPSRGLSRTPAASSASIRSSISARRRYGASHGVGLPSWSCQDLREPTPCP
jgi:hypothetical protein